MSQLDAALSFIGAKKWKCKTVWQAQTSAAWLAKSNHQASLDHDGDDSDGRFSSSDKENDDRASLLQDQEREKNWGDEYKKQFYNAHKQAKYWQKRTEDYSSKVAGMERQMEDQETDLRPRGLENFVQVHWVKFIFKPSTGRLTDRLPWE